MKNTSEQYTGPERREEQRRAQPDRRKFIRFELEKGPRRKSRGRRRGEIKDFRDV